MNIAAISAAFLGTFILMVTLRLAGRVQVAWQKPMVLLAGILLTMFCIGNVPLLFGDDSVRTGALAGQWFGGMVLVTVFVRWMLIWRRRRQSLS
jgi:hypothetical protein